MADFGWENLLSTPYAKQSPEQVKRAQEFAYALMKSKDGRGSTSGYQPIADVLQTIAGIQRLNNSTIGDYNQRQEAGLRRADTVEDAQQLLGRRPVTSPNKGITTGAIPQVKPPTGPRNSVGTDPAVNAGELPDDNITFPTDPAPSVGDAPPGPPTSLPPGDEPTPGQIEGGGIGEIKSGYRGVAPQIPPFDAKVDKADPANFRINDYLKRLTGPESSGGTNTKATGSYFGPFQMQKGAYGLNDKSTPEDHIRAARQRTQENIEFFKKKSGGKFPTETALHLMHNQGATGGTALLTADPGKPAWQVIKEATPGISDALAKQKIRGQIGSGAALSKKATEDITANEFRQYMDDKFNGGWKTRTNALPGQQAGMMRLGGDTDPNNPMLKQAEGAGDKVAQNLPGVPPPTPLRHPSPNLSREELGKFFADPRIPDEVKDKVHEQINKAATPDEREVTNGHQEWRPGNPTDQNLRGKSDTGTMNVGNISVPYTTYRHPDGKTETLFNIPGHGLGSIEDLKAWSRRQGALDTREGHLATKFSDKEVDIQQRAEGAARNRQLLGIARRMASDDSFYTGTGANRVLDYTKIASYVTGNPNWSGNVEAFSKVMAGANIAGLEAFKGYGQIRNPEIELLQQSQGTIANTPQAIKAIITMNEKASERLEEIGEKMRAYRKAKGRIDEGFDEELAKFYKDRPLFTDDEIKDYKKTLFGETKSVKGRFFGGSVPKEGDPEKPAPAKKRTYIPGQGFVEQ